MTAATRRLTRKRPQRPPRGRDYYAALGRQGKATLRKKILALRAAGPTDRLDWINEDYFLRASFEGLEDLGRVHSVTLTSGRHRISETSRTTTLADIRDQVMASLRLVGARPPLRNIVRKILEDLDRAPHAWRLRLRRCRYEPCDHPYFWDDTDAGDKRACSERHKKAAARLTRSSF